MPTISTFFGIVVRMYYDDHPPPHFHAYYGEFSVVIDIVTVRVLEGRFPRRGLALAQEWAVAHQDELMADWALAVQHQPLKRIEPLE